MNLRYWLLAVRPKTLFVIISPVLIGLSLSFSDHYVHMLSACLTLISALCIQMGTNLANDYFDFKKGADTEDRLGPTRVTQAGLISPNQVKWGFISLFGIAVLSAVYLMFRGGAPIVIIGFLSVLFGILYTGGPYPLAYIGVADFFAFTFFGPVAVAGTYYLQTLAYSSTALWLGVAQGCFSMAVLAVNNLRDIDQDSKANKKTLAVRFGSGFGKFQYLTCIFVGIFLPFLFAPKAYAFATILLAALAVPLLQKIRYEKGSSLNDVLAKTARLQFIQGILISLLYLFSL